MKAHTAYIFESFSIPFFPSLQPISQSSASPLLSLHPHHLYPFLPISTTSSLFQVTTIPYTGLITFLLFKHFFSTWLLVFIFSFFIFSLFLKFCVLNIYYLITTKHEEIIYLKCMLYKTYFIFII